MVLDINTERDYPKLWRKEYNKNIKQCLMDLEELKHEIDSNIVSFPFLPLPLPKQLSKRILFRG